MSSPLSSTILTPRCQRIVLAEGDPSLRELLVSALEHDGYEVVQASTGTGLIDQIRGIVAGSGGVDLLISDVRMPKTSGLVVLKLLRAAGLDMPVILVTAFSDVWTRREASEYGAVLLDKPVQLRTLRGEVEKALTRTVGSCTAERSSSP